MAFKRKIPVSTEQFQFRLTVHYPRIDTQAVFKTSDVELQIKALQSHISPLLSVILDGFQKKNPCFHRTISIQIASPLPHDWHSSSFKDNLMFNSIIKALQISYSYLFCLWFWMALKIKSLFPQNNFNSEWQSTTPDDAQAVSSVQSDVVVNIKALQSHYSTSSVCDFGWLSKKSLFPQNNFNSDWQSTTPGWHSKFQTIWCLLIKLPNLNSTCSALILNGSKNKSPCSTDNFIQIDSPLPQMTLKQFQDNLMLY